MPDKPTIHELNMRRCVAAETLRNLGMMNTPVDYEGRLKSDARYSMAKDYADRTSKEYYDALATLSTEELAALSYPSVTRDK